MKKIFLILISTFVLFSENIEKFTSDIVILDNESIAITEDILYNFGLSYRHGIYRDIPKNDTFIKNINCLQNGIKADFKVINNPKYVRIKIGNKNRYVTGKVDYKIYYTISGYIVREQNNLHKIIIDAVGTGFEVPINEANIHLTFPSILINKAKIDVYRGLFGSKNKIHFSIDGNRLFIKAKNLLPKEGITISLSFDKSLIKASAKPSFKFYEKPIYWIFLLPIFAMFYFFTKRYNIFYKFSIAPFYRAPKELNLLEAALLKDNFFEFKELKGALLELANLGFIEFEEIDKNILLKRTDKNSVNLPKEYQILLDAIFKNSNSIYSSDIQISKEDFEDIKYLLHNSLVKKGFFKSSLINARYSFLIIASVVSIVSAIAILFFIFKDIGLELIFPIAIISLFIIVGLYMLISNIKQKSIDGIIFAIVWLIFSSFFLYNITYSKDIFISIILFIAISIIGIIYIYLHINTLTLKGLKAKRELLGLKEFIKRANKDKLAYFLKEDKTFLDKLLPYAVLFELNRHWIELYKELNVDMPSWYIGNYYGFDNLDFNIETLNNNSGNFGSIDSGDFGNFGGFSGGGVGGGGGGSW